MPSENYSLEFNGYRLATNSSSLPANAGIYCVYACVYNTNNDTVSLSRLLYIGEATDVRERIQSHEKWPKWWNELKPGEEISFSVALISSESDRKRAEAAMTFKHKPPCNTEHVDAFLFDTTTVSTMGKNAMLDSSFTVHRM
jgi:hypothetical protein